MPNDIFDLKPTNPISTGSGASITDLDPQDPIVNTEPRPLPVSDLYRRYSDDVSSFSNYSPTTLPFIGGRASAYETRAQNQTAGQLAGNAATQFLLGEFVGGTISGVGTLLSPLKYLERFAGMDDAFEETALEALGTSIQEGTREWAPIYRTAEAQKGVALADPTWWASMTPSIASALSIMLPARMAAVLPVKILNSAKNLTKTARVLEGIQDVEKATQLARNFNRFEKAVTIGASAYAGRVIDSTRESLNKYTELYQQKVDEGWSEDEAKQFATDAAATGFRASHANIIFDVIEWSTMIGAANTLKGGVAEKVAALLGKNSKFAKFGESLGSKVKTPLWQSLTKTAISEGADEMTMDIAQDYGKYKAEKNRGLTNQTFGERTGELLAKRSAWDSFAGGVMGGLFMMPFGTIMEKVGNKSGIAATQKYYENVANNLDAVHLTIQNASEKLDNGDIEGSKKDIREYISNLVTKTSRDNTSDYLISFIEDLSNASEQDLADQGFTNSAKEAAKNLLPNLKQAVDISKTEFSKVRYKGLDDPFNGYLNSIHSQLAVNKFLLEQEKQEILDSTEDALDIDESAREALSEQAYAMYGELSALNANHTVIEKNIKYLKEAIEDNNKAIAEYEERKTKAENNMTKYAIQSRIDMLKNNNKTHEDQIADYQNRIKESKEEIKTLSQRLKEQGDTYLAEANDFLNTNKELIDSNNEIQSKLDSLDKGIELNTKNKQELYKKETIENLKKEYDTFLEESEKQTKADIDTDISSATKESELDDLIEKYKKDGLDKSMYESKIKDARSKLRRQAAQQAQNEAQAQAAQNRQQQPAQHANTNTTQPSSGTSSVSAPIVPGPSSPSTAQTEQAEEPVIPVENPISTPDSEYTYTITPDEQSLTGNPVKDIRDILGSEISDEGILDFTTSFYRLVSSFYTDSFKKHFGLDLSIVDFINKAIGGESFNNPALDNFIQSFLLPINTESSEVQTFTFMGNEILIGVKLANTNVVSQNVSDVLSKYTSENNGDMIISKAVNRVEDFVKASIAKASVLYNIASQAYTPLDAQPDSDINESNTNIPLENLRIARTNTVEFLADSTSLVHDIIQKRSKALGNPIKQLTITDVFKYLRDQDLTNEFIYENYAKAYAGMIALKEYAKARIEYINSKTEGNAKARVKMYQELKTYEYIDSVINIGERPTLHHVESFLETNKRDVTQDVHKSGLSTVINTLDLVEDGNPEDRAIYKILDKLKVNSKVRLIQNPNQALLDPTVDWQTVDVAVEMEAADGKTYPLYIRKLSYNSSGVNYAYKNSNGEYVFRGMSEVLTKDDFSTLASHYDAIKNYYYEYHYNLRNFPNSIEHNDIANKLFLDMIAIPELAEIFKKISNLNLDEGDPDNISRASVNTLFNTMFYKIRLEDAKFTTRSAASIANKVLTRDRALEVDFYRTKRVRAELQQATLNNEPYSININSISTPSPLNSNEHLNKNIRPTIDQVIKPIEMEKGKSPRIVIVRASNGTIIDLHTGRAIKKDERFDPELKFNNLEMKDKANTLFNLIEAPNGKFVMVPLRINTIVQSYNNVATAKKVNSYVALTLFNILNSGSIEYSNSESSKLSDIVINDSMSKSDNLNAPHYLSYGTFPNKTTYVVFQGKQFVDGKQINNWTQLVKAPDGTITVSVSTNWKDILTHRFVVRSGKPYNSKTQFAPNATKEEIVTYLESRTKHMYRQTPIGFKTDTFESRTQSGDKYFDAASEQEFDSVEDYIVKTGAVYSPIGAVYNSKGEVLTNFDIESKAFPIRITLENKESKGHNNTFQSVDELIENGVISKDESYPMLKALERSIRTKYLFIYNAVPITTNDDSVAPYMRVLNGKNIEMFDGFMNLNKKSVSKSLMIAHELIHKRMNQEYNTRLANETEEQKQARISKIEYHNTLVRAFTDELTQQWNDMSIAQKQLLMQKVFGVNTNTSRKIGIFNNYISELNKDIERAERRLDMYKTGEPFNNEITAQEVFTYSLSDKNIALILNSLDSTGEHRLRRNTFWGKLADIFFKILNNVLGVEIRRDSRLAEIPSLIDNIFYGKESFAKETIQEDDSNEAEFEKEETVVEDTEEEEDSNPYFNPDESFDFDLDQFIKPLDYFSDEVDTSYDSRKRRSTEEYEELLDDKRNKLC